MSRYNFDELGWLQFEELCQSLLKASLSIGIESWGGSRDQGRDAKYVGRLPLPDESVRNKKRTYVFQAKFVSNANAAGAKSDAELRKAVEAEKARIKGDEPDCYVLMTNVPVTVSLRDNIEKRLRERLPKADLLIWGSKDLSDLLDGHPSLRTAFPQLLSIRDLQYLVLESIRKPHQERARGFIDRAREATSTFVPTEAYWNTLQLLRDHNMAVLSGPPEMGKTTTALIVGLAKTQENWQCFECRTPADFFELVDKDAQQLFVADDAFGTTEYKPRLAEEWASDLDSLLRNLNRTHWFIWTSRTAPLERALKKMNLQGRAERFPNPAQITVDASRLTKREKALMLYRHARAAGLNDEAKAVVRSQASMIVANKHFTPKRVQRFVDEWLRSANLASLSKRDLKLAVEAQIRTPTEGMRKSSDALPDTHKRLLVSVLDLEGIGLTQRYAALNKGEHATPPKKIAQELEGQFLAPHSGIAQLLRHAIDPVSKEPELVWTHPSWRDLVIAYLSETAEERRSFLSSCGIAGLELALSTAGGVAGERENPLLVDEEDWKVLSSRVANLVREVPLDEIVGIIVTLAEALTVWAGASQEETLGQWSAATLETAHARWSNGVALTVRELKEYLQLSERLRPIPPVPDISGTWFEYVKAARLEIAKPDWFSGLPNTKAWLELVGILRDNEPRFLRQVGFPAEYEGLITQIFDATEEYVNADRKLASAGAYEDQVSSLEALDDICSLLAVASSSNNSRAVSIRQAAKRKIGRYHQKLDSLASELKSAVIKGETDADKISIEKIFRDL